MKTCTICKTPKELSEFYTYKKGDGYESKCKSCESDRKKSVESVIQRKERYKKNSKKIIKYNGDFRLKHIDKYRETHRRYYQNNKERWVGASWKKKGVLNSKGDPFTKMDFDQMMSVQNNKCAVCQSDGKSHSKGLMVDHNHSTGIARGLLCGFCNTAIAYLKEDEVIMKNCINYINNAQVIKMAMK